MIARCRIECKRPVQRLKQVVNRMNKTNFIVQHETYISGLLMPFEYARSR
jgi:hypothetical protein